MKKCCYSTKKQPDLHFENGYVYTYLIISNDVEFCKGTTGHCIRMNM